MVFMISNDFYYDYEIIEAPDRITAIEYIQSFETGEPAPEEVSVIASSENTFQVDALAMADEVLFITDFIKHFSIMEE